MRIDAADVALGAERTHEHVRAMTTTTTIEYGRRGSAEPAAIEERSRTTFLRALQQAKNGMQTRFDASAAAAEVDPDADGGTVALETTRWNEMQASTRRAEQQRTVYKLFLALQQLIAERIFRLIGTNVEGKAADANESAGLCEEALNESTPEGGAEPLARLAGNARAQAGDLTLPIRRVNVETRVDEYERERVAFSAAGAVRTADGRSIDFTVDLEMEREAARQTELSLLVDPLVIQYEGGAAALEAEYFDFDLDADGAVESIPTLASGGYLALDRDGSGAVEDGSELFGATDGDGFGQLAACDDDANGWIDEADPVFDRLGVWTRDEAGAPTLRTLRDCGVGAVHLGHAAGRFSLKQDGETLGVVREHGVALGEDGAAMAVQQIDLAVRPAGYGASA